MSSVARLAGFAVAALAVVACATSPTGRSQIKFKSDAEMAEMGEQAFAQIKAQTRQSRDAQAKEVVNCVVANVIRALPAKERLGWEVVVFDDNMVNAFALPGRKVGVYEGIFRVARNQDQLATVLGHEVAHVLADHANERVSTSTLASGATRALAAGAGYYAGQHAMGLLGVGLQMGVLMPFNRKQESEADEYGLELMAEAGFDPGQSIPLWENMAKVQSEAPPEFLSTHPSGETRIKDLRALLPEAHKLQEQAAAAGAKPDCKF
jgi:predicted Zn-dependent protease